MSSKVIARTGRQRQRYENKLRLVAGCIPYKIKEDVEDHEVDSIYMLQVLMISTPNRQDLVFPKGGWENNETMSEAASREAVEEAGVRGIVIEPKLGEWTFRSKSKEKSCNNEGACKGYMFALQVTEELQFWPEQSTHHRRWVNVMDAFRLCRYPWMQEALVACIKLLSEKLGFCFTGFSELLSYNDNRDERRSSTSEHLSYYFVTPAATKQAIGAIC